MAIRPRVRRTPLMALAATAALGLVVTTVPQAVATAPTHTQSPLAKQAPDHSMYVFSVRAVNGDIGALANRLDALGYDVASRSGDIVKVLGTTVVKAALSRVPGAAVVATTYAAPLGPIPKAPANQNNILPRKLKGKHYKTFYGGYRTVAGYEKFESDLQKAYPKLVQVIKFGTSFTGDNSLYAVCITANANKGCQLTPKVHKARFFLMSQIHAREIATSETSWRFMTALIDGWKRDAQTTSLLKSTEIWIVPQVNPDGIDLVQDGIANQGTGDDSPAWQRKNDDEDQTPAGGCGGTWAYSQPGVDLNRNNDFEWGGQGTSEDPCDQEYLGSAADSESETTALQTLFTELFKDQRGDGLTDPAPKKTTGEMITMHTDGDVLLFPWSFDDTVHAPNDAGLRNLGFRESYYNHYTTGQSGQVLYNAAGTTDDWTYDKLGIASFTWELWSPGACGGFLPLYSCMDQYQSTNLPGLFYAAAAARTPYKLSLGPTITAASSKAGSDGVDIKATADDDAYGTSGVGRPTAQNVKKALLYIGKAPWDGGTGQAMTIKGKGTSVTLTATVQPGAKKQLAYIQAQDADGNWGPAMAVWIPAAG